MGRHSRTHYNSTHTIKLKRAREIRKSIGEDFVNKQTPVSLDDLSEQLIDCSYCAKRKPLNCFSTNKKAINRFCRNWKCKECQKAYDRKRQQNKTRTQKDKDNQSAKEWRKNNYDRYIKRRRRKRESDAE